jgi:DNA-binding NarL/FixJ family response regulator
MVVAISSQLMDGVAIENAARRLGIPLIVTSPERALEALGRESPALVVLDLTDTRALDLLERGELEQVRTIGYYPHVDQALRERALQAGASRVVPRSAFFGRLHEWLAPAGSARLPEAPGGC